MEAKNSSNLSNSYINFSDTKIAFSHLSDRQLKGTAWLFGMMSKPWLVKMGSPIALWAVENNLPFAKKIVKNTIFKHFCSGTTLLDSQTIIDTLIRYQTSTILDYGAEGKDSESDFNHTMNENIRAIDYASRDSSISVVVTKISGLARFDLLKRIQAGGTMTKEDLIEYRNVLKRLDAICYTAAEKGVKIFIDAEESWIQETLDHLVWIMMKRYNKNKVVVYNTYQMYRHDRLQFLIASFDRAKKEGFMLGAKLVRGAYMNKERDRAASLNYPSPINSSKEATDDSYNTALRFCIDNVNQVASCNASHNAQSALLQVELMEKRGISRTHPHMMFSQLLGMSDNLTFNLANAGYNVGKYCPYGQVQDVIPYLIRRAQENTAVTGDVGREMALIIQEMKRRRI